jgi:hypothetical protein
MAMLIVSTKATAMKRGRNPRWPWVPVLVHQEQWEPLDPNKATMPRQEQIRGVSYATRDEAVAVAQRIAAARERWA